MPANELTGSCGMESPGKPPAPRRRRLTTSPLVIGVVIGLLATVSVGLNTRFASPPRYDGAGYAMLGLGLSQGLGYVELNHPDRPPHAHFPPGYPLLLALLFRAFGPSTGMIHGLSVVLTVASILVYTRWFRSLYPPETATLLGLALAINWTWGRIGGTIQSEPLYLLLGAMIVTILPWASRQGPRGGFVLGSLLASAILTRHVGICLFVAIAIDLAIARRWATLATSTIVVGVLLVPWVFWLEGSGRTTQAGLFSPKDLVTSIASEAIFYARRIPDQLVGPVVEVATVFARSPRLSWIST
ncbi:glycosyltransferase family 39 protein, partial [Singulisphaera rosea]